MTRRDAGPSDAHARPRVPAVPRPDPRPWVVASVVAETIGMTAAATAAVTVDRWLPIGTPVLVALLVLVAGGLVEGLALGLLQSRALARWLSADERRRWALATVLVAGLGWAAASAPALTREGAGDAEPALALVMLGAAAIGVVAGALLGAAQAWAIGRSPRSMRQWSLTSAGAWTVAMPVIFLGATLPQASWPGGMVVATGTITGLTAGTALGVLSCDRLVALTGAEARRRSPGGRGGTFGTPGRDSGPNGRERLPG